MCGEHVPMQVCACRSGKAQLTIDFSFGTHVYKFALMGAVKGMDSCETRLWESSSCISKQSVGQVYRRCGRLSCPGREQYSIADYKILGADRGKLSKLLGTQNSTRNTG
jgi:hypothetical protein